MSLQLFKHWTNLISPHGTVLRAKYESFKKLLESDKRSHELISELEAIYYQQKKVDIKVIESRYEELSGAISTMVDSLLAMAPASYDNLRDFFKKIDVCIRFILTPTAVQCSPPFTISLKDVRSKDVQLVGGKAFNLAILQNSLNVTIPEGLVITTNAFYRFIEFNHLRPLIDEKLAKVDIGYLPSLHLISEELVSLVSSAQVPPDVAEDIQTTFKALVEQTGYVPHVAMRSSAVSEDSQYSFAGQYLSVLNCPAAHLLEAYKQVIASKYSPRALYYRINYGLSDLETPMAVLLIEMIDAAVSGIIYTTDLSEADSECLSIHSLWGLGEPLAGGEISPDIVTILKDVNPVIVRRQSGDKFRKSISDPAGGSRLVEIEGGLRFAPSLTDEEALALSRLAMQIEKLHSIPQDIEWCMDHNHQLFILQARTLQVKQSESDSPNLENMEIPNDILIHAGERASAGCAGGRVYKVEDEETLLDIPQDSVLVARTTLPAYAKVMNRLRAVVTDRGSVAGHFSSVAREYGIPTLVNTRGATSKLSHGQEVTVLADRKTVYEGIIPLLCQAPQPAQNLACDSHYLHKLKYMLDFISPLSLLDVTAASFAPEGCRSLHDIIRFTHEKSMHEMFTVGQSWGGMIQGAKTLISSLPFTLYVLDVGGGLLASAQDKQSIPLTEVVCHPLLAVWQGLSHPGVEWQLHDHFDWKAFDDIVLGGGIASKESGNFASYAVVSGDYLNLNIRFGYHFTILDTICGDRIEDNYISVRFAGGGGNFDGRLLRLELVAAILKRLDFTVKTEGDLLDAKLVHYEQEIIQEKLDIVGRLLGATRLMDMVLKDNAMVAKFVDDFFYGRYNFSSEKV